MSDLVQTLLDSIHADPRDETAWLALADHLEEQADPRAELVRLTHRLRHEDFHDERPALERRLCALLLQGVRPVVPVLIGGGRIELALVPLGRFRMGASHEEEYCSPDELPTRIVEITRPFYLGIYPITQEQFEAVMGFNPSHFSPAGPIPLYQIRDQPTTRFPVDGVSWQMARDFCHRLSEMHGERGRIYRLPTEAEWEYACRAGTSTAFAFGEQLGSQLANFDGCYPFGGAQPHVYLKRTCRVGSYLPNAFGLYDMHGNVWERCSDWFDEAYYQQGPNRDPPGPATGTSHVLRGGSWIDAGWHCRSADRSASEASHYVGFRVAMDVSDRAGYSG